MWKRHARNGDGQGSSIIPEKAFRLQDLDPHVQRRLLMTFLAKAVLTGELMDSIVQEIALKATRSHHILLD